MFGRKNPQLLFENLLHIHAQTLLLENSQECSLTGILSALRTSCSVLGEGNEMDAIATVGISALGIFSGVHVSAVLGLTPVL